MEQKPCLYEHLIWTNCQNAAETDENVLINALLYDSIQLHQDLQIVEDLKTAKTEIQRWAILINAIKELNGTNTTLKTEIDNLKTENTALKTKLTDLETRLKKLEEALNKNND